MRIAILGGGITGLTTAYYLNKKGYKVSVFEKENNLGGLASGFKTPTWNWYLERTYHHLFSNDSDILNFAKEIGFNDIYFQSPLTASLYKEINNYRIIPVDTPQDFLKIPYLNLVDKLRAGLTVVFLKLSPFLKVYEKNSAEVFLKKTMGERVWDILWRELFRKKFGEYAGIILTSFIWARIKKRTKSLGYIKGGFQELINYLHKLLVGQQVNVSTNFEVKEISKKGEKYLINNQLFDAVVSTLPTPIMIRLTKNVFPEAYLKRISKIKYLSAVNLILETDKPLIDKTYWLNVCDKNIPIMCLVQHTNFINKKNYGNKHLLYVANYVGDNDKLLKMSKEEILNFYAPYLKKISPNYQPLTTSYYLFKAPFAQPIFDKEFIKNKPEFITPQKNFYIANLDMTYPYDRGTNFAVKLGKKVAELV